MCAVYLSVGEVPVESIGMHCPVLEEYGTISDSPQPQKVGEAWPSLLLHRQLYSHVGRPGFEASPCSAINLHSVPLLPNASYYADE